MAVKIPPIIEKELFDKVQKQILLNGKYASRNRKRDYLLPGLVYCTCGLKRVGETSSDHKHIYYRCAERIYKHPHPRQCFEKSVNARMLDKLVMEKVLKIFSNEDLIRRQAERWIKTTKTSDNYERELELKNHKIELLNAEEEKYLKAYGAGITSFEVYESRMKDLNSRRDHLKNEQNELKLAIVKLDNKPSLDIDLICQKALDTINNFDLEDKQLFLRKTLDKVVTNQEQAIVYGFIPINLDKGDKNVGFQIKHRHRRLTKCRQINTI
jgi:site-specific DNA recombinase